MVYRSNVCYTGFCKQCALGSFGSADLEGCCGLERLFRVWQEKTHTLMSILEDQELMDRMDLHDVTKSSLRKLAVSKSRTQRGAVVHNTAMDCGLQHRLRTMDDLKAKSQRASDFDQQKFINSLSDENNAFLRTKPKSPRKRPDTTETSLTSPMTPRRSKSIIQTQKTHTNSQKGYSTALELYDQSKSKKRGSLDPRQKQLTYSISSNMKIADCHARKSQTKSKSISGSSKIGPV
ncbi:hypothetical protein CAPTEDRAFT_208121 [Capitella teleta]|uniref:Uncharacterized protein n=1 Tax=Capitella teleta TaxID=283909 RepID=R7UZF5_CAPTE|nr:hypothetical protein CAPTEDRAFT_208121 [Capitella teleta]|eukprot:ELU08816.1 hypothetical protein CAPTEDRAFT_208121 [Capitella teleta]